MIDRRKFLKYAAAGTGGLAALCAGYSFIEAAWFRVVEERIAVPGLPSAFRGLRVAFLTDMHHGPWTGLKYIESAVNAANELRPDLVLLGGDYSHNGTQYIEPCIDVLGALTAPLGVMGVLGNHDAYNGLRRTVRSMENRKIPCLVNEAVILERGGQRLRLLGVDDLSHGSPDLKAAISQVGEDEPCLLLCHNPDFTETVKDPRIKLIISGHTHGGQVVFPVIGAPYIPSSFGQKYRQGLIKTEHTQVFVSRGLGTVTPPVRFCCRPELNLLILE